MENTVLAPEYVLGIVGSREYSDYISFSRIIDDFIQKNGSPTKIVSGGAVGADTMARKYALEHSIPLVEYLPNYSLGRNAPLLRNTLIVNDCTVLIAFPSKDSRGTWDSIRKAQAAGKPVFIYSI